MSNSRADLSRKRQTISVNPNVKDVVIEQVKQARRRRLKLQTLLHVFFDLEDTRKSHRICIANTLYGTVKSHLERVDVGGSRADEDNLPSRQIIGSWLGY